MFAKWTIKTDLRLNLAGEYKFHYDMFPLWLVLVGSMGHMIILGVSFLALLALVGFLVDAGLLHGLLLGEELVEGRRLGVGVPVL